MPINFKLEFCKSATSPTRFTEVFEWLEEAGLLWNIPQASDGTNGGQAQNSKANVLKQVGNNEPGEAFMRFAGSQRISLWIWWDQKVMTLTFPMIREPEQSEVLATLVKRYATAGAASEAGEWSIALGWDV